MIREQLEAHAVACRDAIAAGRDRPLWTGANLTGADLTGANLSGIDLTGTDLSDTDLRRANLSGANLSGATLTRAHLARADLAGANLSGANLAGATLTGASLRWADITGADLTGATLTGADLRWTTLVGADLTGARLSEGVARGRAIGGHVGGHHWWAVELEDGGAVLQFGCEHHILEWWLARGPELCVRHGHPAEFWVEGPAVAIAAAQKLVAGLSAVPAVHDRSTPMTFDEYQKAARETAIYPRESAVIYPALGLAGETGETVEHVKKWVRDGVLNREAVQKEMGDILWYLANLAEDLGVSLGEIAIANLSKLRSRKERNVLHGSGDDR